MIKQLDNNWITHFDFTQLAYIENNSHNFEPPRTKQWKLKLPYNHVAII